MMYLLRFSQKRVDDDVVQCLMVKVEDLCAAGETCDNNPNWRCIAQNDETTYSMQGLTKGFLKSLKSGETILTVSTPKPSLYQAKQVLTKTTPRNSHQTIVVSDATTVTTTHVDDGNQWHHGDGSTRRLRRNRRQLESKTIGTPTMLVIRVVDAVGDAPKQSKNQLSDDVFGTFGDPINLVRFVEYALIIEKG